MIFSRSSINICTNITEIKDLTVQFRFFLIISILFCLLLYYTDLCSMVKSCVSDSVVINLELVNSPDIRDLEYGLIDTIGLLLQSGADERINAYKLQLDIIGVEWLPFAILQLFNFNPVYLYDETVLKTEKIYQVKIRDYLNVIRPMFDHLIK